MNLNFEKKNDVWVAEFEVTTDFNIHIEGVADNGVKVYQNTNGGNNYAFVRDSLFKTSYGKVYDVDFAGIVYPKNIKVVCTTQPTVAVITEAENFGGGSSGPSTITFNIGDSLMTAEEGMTWYQWCESKYNTEGWYCEGDEHRIYFDVVVSEDSWGYSEWRTIVKDNMDMLGGETIIEGEVYSYRTDSDGIGGGGM